MTLRDEIVGACTICGRTGYVGSTICECLLKFRAYNRLVGNGFKHSLLNLVAASAYRQPFYESGQSFVQYYLDNIGEVEGKGLSLYIDSRERGRGKTTLAHFLMYNVAHKFSSTENYRRESSLSFGFEHAGALVKNVEDDKRFSTFYVLDDLGAEERTGYKRDVGLAVLQEILHYRRDNRLSTIITSNYNPKDLSGLYSGVLDSLLEISAAGDIQGSLFRRVELGGDTDLRLSEDSEWPKI